MKRGFIELPYLPRDLVGLVLVDKRISQDAYKRLKKLYINIIKTVICSELYDAVCCHPDMVVTPMGGRLIVVAPNVVGYYGPIFRRLGFDVIEGRTFLERNYPWNIAYNVCRVGNFLIHNLKYTDESILKIAQEKKLKKISVPQAYSKCSIIVINESAIITSDISIHSKVGKYGIDSLLVNPEEIVLSGLNHGLIGGSCGFLNKDLLGFFGDIRHLKNYKEIKGFLEKYNKKYILLEDNRLQDLGSLIPLKEVY